MACRCISNGAEKSVIEVMATENKYDLVVVGGGPAGMIAAINAAQNGFKTLICEKNPKLGRKLLITGKGRCNVTNNCDVKTCIDSVTSNSSFLYSAFNFFTPQDTMDFFEQNGLELKTERGNRVFPTSDKALDVVNTLIRLVNENNVTVIQADVKKLIINDNIIEGVESASGDIYHCDNVIIACGGRSYPRTGSTGDGYRLAKQAGHTITPIRPSLVPIVSNDSFCAELQGLSLKNTHLSLVRKNDKKCIFEDFGEMLFTHFGMSGPVVLSASAHVPDAKCGEYELVLDLKPALSYEKTDSRLLRDFAKFQNKDIGNSLFELLPRSMIPVILKRVGIPADTKCNSVTRAQRERLCKLLKGFTVSIDGFRPIEEAIITKGGVNVKEITPKTMESKLCKGLYFAGEVIDVDAYTGGFNLQIAFSTGMLASSSI